MAWDVLSDEEKREILALFPDGQHLLNPGTKDARPDMDALRSDDTWRHDIARYVEYIQEGKCDPQWLAEAFEAREHRKRGEYDDYLAHKLEEDWGEVERVKTEARIEEGGEEMEMKRNEGDDELCIVVRVEPVGGDMGMAGV
ncbi:unnamed protein product [Parascedosporium putredinis]|uniref:ASX DEUBAD domain-containing protein n=1 Tax=Parascedosporium putredinis TaxID=1442378 RepID=A0A9P1GUF3_9PEZI|nr:unnamed protein product [Parascedosporium putredinis]CAI7987543.1 unnamed protein product [Parascedosporium putredinis]